MADGDGSFRITKPSPISAKTTASGHQEASARNSLPLCRKMGLLAGKRVLRSTVQQVQGIWSHSRDNNFTKGKDGAAPGADRGERCALSGANLTPPIARTASGEALSE